MKRIKEKNGSRGGSVKIAAGLATLAVGAYLFYGKGAKARRVKLTGWAKDMVREVRQRAKSLAKLDRQTFHKVVDRVADEYRNTKAVKAQELHRVSNGLKGAWATLGSKAKIPHRKMEASKS